MNAIPMQLPQKAVAPDPDLLRPAKSRTKNTPPIDPQAVILRIRMVVQDHGSVREVAERCGMPQATLEVCVKGQSLPGTLAIASLCHGLSISADWLLFGEVAK